MSQPDVLSQQDRGNLHCGQVLDFEECAIMDISKFFTREYVPSKYTCAQFVAEVYQELTGRNIDSICQAFVTQDAFASRIRTRVRMLKPQSPCVAIMRFQDTVPHAGIFIDGQILHLSHDGVKLEPLSSLSQIYAISYYL